MYKMNSMRRMNNTRRMKSMRINSMRRMNSMKKVNSTRRMNSMRTAQYKHWTAKTKNFQAHSCVLTRSKEITPEFVCH